MKTKVILLFASFLVFVESRRNPFAEPFFEPYRRPSGCQWCFTEDKCFRGAQEENIPTNCTSCIQRQCGSENPRRSYLWSRCVFDAWQGWPCNSICPPWDWRYTLRATDCRECIRKCQDREKSSDYCKTNRDVHPCRTCVNADQCFSKDEVQQIFSRFCLNFIHISCENDFSNECILQTIQSPCSQCNANYSVIDRLTSCAGCLDSCRAEGLCIRDCTANKYPTSLSCGYCSYFCKLEGRRSYPGLCNFNSRCGEACNNCNTCTFQCRISHNGDFDYRDRCDCITKKKQKAIKKIGLVNFLRFPLK